MYFDYLTAIKNLLTYLLLTNLKTIRNLVKKPDQLLLNLSRFFLIFDFLSITKINIIGFFTFKESLLILSQMETFSISWFTTLNNKIHQGWNERQISWYHPQKHNKLK